MVRCAQQWSQRCCWPALRLARVCWVRSAARIGETKPIIDARVRYEDVDQDPHGRGRRGTDVARATRFRDRQGLEDGAAGRRRVRVAAAPATTTTRSTARPAYPVVADPESYEVNRLQLTNTSLPRTTVTLGRQRIVLDDQRFVGNVGWRQNEQTFDALRVVNKTVPNFTVDVTYLNQVNRVFGKDSPQGRYEGDSYFANVVVSVADRQAHRRSAICSISIRLPARLRPSATRQCAIRHETYGVRFAGERPLSQDQARLRRFVRHSRPSTATIRSTSTTTTSLPS